MKKITLILFTFFIWNSTFSQCINSNENPVLATVSDNSGEIQEIYNLIFTDEFSTISNIITGDEYKFTNTHDNGINDYITITDESDNLIVQGNSPLTTNIINVAIIRMHISVDAACNDDLFSHTTTIQNLTKAVCNKPTGLGISYKSDTRLDFFWSPPSLSTPNGYDWEIVPDGNAQGVGVVASGFVSAPTTTASSGEVLSAGIAYDLYLRSNCEGDANGTSGYYLLSNGNIPGFTTNSNSPPVNDFCNGAMSITEETGIPNAAAATPIAGTLLGGAGTDVNAELCNGITGNARDDVWFSFLAQTTDVTINLEPTNNDDFVLTLYSGDCNSLVYLDCSDINITNPSPNEEISYSGLVIGQTYYTRAYFFGATTPLTPTFNLKIWSSTVTVDSDSDGFSDDVDCDDINPAINPGATEVCDGVDNNCDTIIDEGLDADSDGIANCFDICPGFDDNIDTDGDGVPDGCDSCPADNPDDSDADGVCDSNDICPGFDDNIDTDGDGVPDGCDSCPVDNPDDSDADGVCDSNDICPGFDDNIDTDGDGVPDGCDSCPADNPDDSDADGVCDSNDICPGFDDNIDTDGDGIPDGCDILNVDDFNLESIVIRPNPFKQRISIHLPSSFDNDSFKINLFDLNGRLIFNNTLTSINKLINIDNLERIQHGIYFIKISNLKNGSNVIRQLIKY